MSGESGGIDREILLYLVIGLVLVVPIAQALVFDVTSEAGAEWEVTPAGPTVYFDEDRSLPSGSPFPASNSVHIQTSSGSAYYNGTVDTRARIDVMNGTWSNVSQLDVTAGNLTINPQGMQAASVSGDANRFAFKGQAGVDDGQVDAVVAGNGGAAKITLSTDGTNGEDYALVDDTTSRVLAVGTADSTGTVAFDALELSSHTLRVQSVGDLTIREATPNHPLVTGSGTTPNTVVKLFNRQGEEIAELEDSDEDGKIDLSNTNLPLDQQFTAQIDAANHPQRTAIIEDLGEQSTLFVLNQTQNLEKEFIVRDQTGLFDGENTELVIQRAIDTTEYGGGQGITYKNVAGDELGADRAFITTLQEDVRYRIIVRNLQGDVRQLGAFTPEAAGTTALEVQAVNVSASDQAGIQYNATLDRSTSPDRILLQYNDTRELTETLFVEIHERDNRSNKLVQNTTYTGPLNVFRTRKHLPTATRPRSVSTCE